MKKKIVPDSHSGGITCCSQRSLTKEQFLRLIENEFPDDNTFEKIVAITTVDSNDGTFQSVTFGKVLNDTYIK